MTRRRLSTRRRGEIFAEHKGVCALCNGKIQQNEAWELDHRIPLAMGGEDEPENWQLAHRKCHRAKTDVDVGQIAKAKRVEAKHNGTWAPRSRLPGSRDSGWKHTFRHGWVRRG